MLKKQKLMLGGLLVIVVFFAVTFSKNWGTAVSGNLLDKYKDEVKRLQSDPNAAMITCPAIIKKLEKGIPELSKSKDPNKVQLANKLIADCAFASKNYSQSIEFYKKLSDYEPNYPRWYALIAEALLYSEKPGDALHYSVLAMQLDPANFNFKRLNARVLAKLGLKNRAIDAYAKAIKIAPYEEISVTKAELEKYLSASEEVTDAALDINMTE